MRDAVILDAVRTPIGRYAGVLSPVRPDDLAARTLVAAVERNGLDPATVDEVYMGCTNQAGEDNRNVARMASLIAGLPVEVPGVTVNRLCASGLEAIVQAGRQVRLGEAELVLAGGVESMSRAPLVMLKPERGFPRGNSELVDTTIGWRFINPSLAKRHSTESMGETAENVAERYEVAREDQDAFALESHRRAIAAAEAGRFDDELVTVDVPQPKGDPVKIHADEGPRSDTSLERLARLRPIFRDGGSVTAGNASQINDGAACVVVTSEERASELGQRATGEAREQRVGRRGPRLHGNRPRAGLAQGTRARWPGAEGHRPGGVERGVRVAGARLDARARLRARPPERERRRDRARPSAGRLRRPAARHTRLGAAPPRRPLRPRHDVHRRGPGPRRCDREPSRALEATVSPLAIPPQRLAVESDAASISELMRISVLDLFPRFYDEQQTASAAVHIAHLDMQLINDGTYFVHEAGGELVACGGWSRRNKLYSGPGDAEDDDRLLDPGSEPARVRAMFVRSDFTRRGLGRAILESCERAARDEGFTDFVLGATLPGEPLYRAFGFREVERFRVTMPDGVSVECVGMERPIGPLPSS